MNIDEFNWIKGREKNNGKFLRITKTTAGRFQPQMRIGISQEAMKVFRFVIGDRVLVGFNNDFTMLAMRRTIEGGHSVSLATGMKNPGTYNGQTLAGSIKFNIPTGMNENILPIELDSNEVQIKDNLILVPLQVSQNH